MSTVSVGVSERVAERAADAGVEYLRAPVSGNPAVVRGGTLTIVVSGPEDVAAERSTRCCSAIGPKVLYVGEGERARVVKLALQVLIGGTAELLGEALVLGEAGRRRPREAARGDRRLRGRLAVRRLQERAAARATTTRRRSRRR